MPCTSQPGGVLGRRACVWWCRRAVAAGAHAARGLHGHMQWPVEDSAGHTQRMLSCQHTGAAAVLVAHSQGRCCAGCCSVRSAGCAQAGAAQACAAACLRRRQLAAPGAAHMACTMRAGMAALSPVAGQPLLRAGAATDAVPHQPRHARLMPAVPCTPYWAPGCTQAGAGMAGGHARCEARYDLVLWVSRTTAAAAHGLQSVSQDCQLCTRSGRARTHG